MTSNGGGTALVERAETAVRAGPAFADGESFATAQRVGTALASSDLVPQAYRGNLPNVLVAMEYAHRLGASVLAVMQNLDVIHGRPSLRATFLIGTVNASGRFTPIRFRWQGTEGKDDWGCRAWATDREAGEECVGPLITVALAKSEGWHGKSGSKWKTMPEMMLMYRSAAWWTRVYAPELSLGLHTTDEIEDVGPAPVQRITAAVEALDAPDDVPNEDDDGRPATAVQFGSLISLREKARAADLLSSGEEAEIEAALGGWPEGDPDSGDGTAVRAWIRKLNLWLADAAKGRQADLLGGEG